MLKDILVREWMSDGPVTITPKTPIATAHQIMTENSIRRLPVVDKGQLMGIVTIGDVREAKPSDATALSIWELNYLWSQILVQDVMTRDVFTVGPDEPLINAARIMLEEKISGLPVVQGDHLVGIITESDVFRMLVKAVAEEV